MLYFNENKKMFSAIKELKEELERKNRQFDSVRSVFLSNVSHELRTPMNAIVGFANLLADDDLGTDEKKEFIRHINDNSDLLMRLIDNMVDLTMLQSGNVKLKSDKLCLNSMITDLYIEYKNSEQVKSKKLQLIPCRGDEELSAVITDTNRLQSIMRNLIDSALRNTPGGFVKFGFGRRGNNMQFFVSYSGKMFELENEMKGDLNGGDYVCREGNCGLPLVIARSIIEIMNGELWTESDTHCSALNFTLPLKINKGLMERFYKLGVSARKNIAL